MKLSEQSLRNWIDTKLNIQAICEQLTMSGLEVEDIQYYIKKFSYIYIGEIIALQQHPNVTYLIIVQINLGKKIVNIVCESGIVSKNMKVFVACHGAKLCNKNIIETMNIQGITSEGVICTLSDLGFIDYKNTIIVLPYSSSIGLCVMDYIFYQDTIIKINTMFNRLDVLGAFGVARDVAILNNLPIPKIMRINIPVTITDYCKICVEDHNIVYRCCGVLIRNINLNIKTPIWMKEKLRKYDINSVNIVVDIINYVFIELGQSIYSFSFFDQIYDIIVSCKNNNMYCMKYNNHVISFLGNIDFNMLPINVNDTNLFIGSFFIDPNILNHSLYYAKNKYQFKTSEYFVDPVYQEQIIEYATNLFIRICGGNVSKRTCIQSNNYHNFIYRKIKLSHTYIIKILGNHISRDVIEKILIQLKYKIILINNIWYVIPPSWRMDILSVEDVISDMMRIYQYDKILPVPLINKSMILQSNKLENFLKRVKYTLIDRGYYEVINYSFIDPKIQSYFHKKQKYLSLMNPISQDMSCMRRSIWPGLIKTLLYHQNRQHHEIRFFESGLCFIPDLMNKLGVHQNLHFAGIISNIDYKKHHWDISARRFDFYDLKGDIESIFDTIGYLENIIFKRKEIPGLHVSNSVEIMLDKHIIGIMGEIDPFVLKKLHINYSTFVFELFWHKIEFKDQVFVKKISDFPHSIRDISIIVNENMLIGDLVLCLRKQFLNEIHTIKISDIYTGHTIKNGKKSVTLTLLFQSIYKTLTDDYINDIIKRFLQYLYDNFHAVLR
ncbi:phenylalanine--tRNA ligase subunit beta [Buchnera aphidicola (Takecallis taiwana)]|uniref:phenylalanine--tRNA ligase subunit beta n=1 Tax=Buchnera aphidicola TaxID=9 RepID=UPI0031B73EE9